MDDPAVPSTKTRGRPKGGRGRGKSRGLVVKKHKGIDHNKKQAVDVAEPAKFSSSTKHQNWKALAQSPRKNSPSTGSPQSKQYVTLLQRRSKKSQMQQERCGFLTPNSTNSKVLQKMPSQEIHWKKATTASSTIRTRRDTGTNGKSGSEQLPK
jgi:hypothetical protein